MPRWLTIQLSVLLMGLPGCGTESLSPAQQFVRDQEGIVTPNGRIDANSVRDLDGRRIQYKTSDGRTWSVSWTSLSDGSRDYGIPEELTPGHETDPATPMSGSESKK